VLQDTNAHAAACLHSAAGRRELATTAGSAVPRRFCRLDDSWTSLGRSRALTERLSGFCASQRGARPETASAEKPGSHKVVRQSGRVRNGLVAIVDDDQCAREGINALIASLGYSSAMFMSAEEYLGSESKPYTACLILDVHLPGMSGPELQDHLTADGGRTPIVFVTGLFDERVRNRVIDAGALAYLTKPCDESALISCLVQALGN
jgi:CheY-like chemotaxis protein